MSKRKSLTLNAILNVCKQICAIIFPMITFPYVSRVLGAETYGKINFSASIISYISLIATLGITNYAVREGSRVKDDSKLFGKKVNEIFSINLFTTVLAYIVLGGLLLFWPKLKGYEMLILIQSVTVLFTTVGTDWINTIYEDFTYLTVRYLIFQVLALGCLFIFVRTQGDYLIYVIISCSTSVLANICNIFYIRNKLKVKIGFTLRMNLAEHLKPIMILFGSVMASLVYINSDVTILGIFHNDEVVGYYSVSAKIYTLIKQVINAALFVLLPRMAKAAAENSSEEINRKISTVLSLLMVGIGPACAGLYMLAEEVVVIYSGESFAMAAGSLRILALALPFACIACMYVDVVMVPLKMEMKVLWATVISAAVNIVLNIILIPRFGQLAAAGTTVLSELIMVLCGVICTYKHIKPQIFKALICMAIEIGCTVGCCVLARYLFDNRILILCVSVVSDIVLCGLLVLAFFRKDLRKKNAF